MKALRQQEKCPARRVDVTVSETESGSREVLVRDMSYGSGVGWYVQRTIRLDTEQVDALMRSLCCARQSCHRARHEISRVNKPGTRAGTEKIVQLTRFEPGA